MTEGGEARRGKDALSLSGGHLCHVCGHQYPNPNPSAKLRRSHRRNCRRPSPGHQEEPSPAGERRNAGLALGGGGGELGDGEEPGNAAASGGSASPGSAEGGGGSSEDKENADESNGANLARPFTNGIQQVPKTFTKIAPLAVAHPPEREDSFDEYQDASPFLQQSDPEDGAAVAHESDIPMEIKNLDKGSVGTNVATDAIFFETNGSCEDQLSSKPSIPDFPAGSKVENGAECYLENVTPESVGHEDGLILQSTDECSANVCSNDTDVVVVRKSDETTSYCQFIGDLSAPSLQKCSLLMPDAESRSACSRKMDSFLKDGKDVLDSMSEESSTAEIPGSDNIGSETVYDSGTNSVPTGEELELIHTENTSSDCSTECSSQNLSVQGTKDVQLPVDNSCLVNAVCSVPGYQNDFAVTNFNGMLKSVAEDDYNKDNLVKGSELDFSCEERLGHDVEQTVTVAEGGTSLEKHNGFFTEEVCIRESDTEVPTKYQVSSSQEHVTLLMDQVSSIKNPFALDDTRSEDLFELASGSYHFDAPDVESKQQIDSTTWTVPNQTSVADGQHSPISDDQMLAVSSENRCVVGAEESVSTSADPNKNSFFHEASVNHNKQEGESHTNGTIYVPSQVFPTEFGGMPVSQEIDALSTYVGEKAESEDTDAKDMTAVESIDKFEEKKQTEDACAKEMNAVLHTDNVEDEKLAEENGVKEKVDEYNQSEATGSREARAVQSTVNVHEKDQTEGSTAKKTDTEFCTNDADNKQTDDTNKEEMYEVQHKDNTEEKEAEETTAKEADAVHSTDTAEEQKQTEGTVCLEGSKQNEEIAAIGSRLNSARISVPLKVLLAEASLESKEKKPSTKERVLSFRRRASLKDGNSSAKPGSAGMDDQYWNSPAKLPHDNNVGKRSRVRKQPWMPFICCHSVH
uniref:Uncharacterized protein n=1 Tax=Avena sativa TaxID=4498 RepID=A0ACD5XTK2_AVESA